MNFLSAFPLPLHRGRTDNEDLLSYPAVDQFLYRSDGRDGLAQAHVVSQEEGLAFQHPLYSLSLVAV